MTVSLIVRYIAVKNSREEPPVSLMSSTFNKSFKERPPSFWTLEFDSRLLFGYILQTSESSRSLPSACRKFEVHSCDVRVFLRRPLSFPFMPSEMIKRPSYPWLNLQSILHYHHLYHHHHNTPTAISSNHNNILNHHTDCS